MVVLLVTVTALALALFAYENPGTVTVNFAAWTWEDVPLWYPVAAAAVAVFSTCAVWMLASRRRRRLVQRILEEAEIYQGAVLADHDAAIADLRWQIRRLREELARGHDATPEPRRRG
jgi:uncharacterized integral membrane protein